MINIKKFVMFLILLVLTLKIVQSEILINNATVTTVNIDDYFIPNITDIATDPSFPFQNNGSEQNIWIKFTSNEFPLKTEIRMYNSTNNPSNLQGFYIRYPGDFPINYKIPSGLSDGAYWLNLSFTDTLGNADSIVLGKFSVLNFIIENSQDPNPTPLPHESGRSCLTSWTCSEWSDCSSGVQSRACKKENPVCYASINNKPVETQSCQEKNPGANFQPRQNSNPRSLLTGGAIQVAFEKGEITKKGTMGSMAISLFLIPEHFLFKLGRKRKNIQISSRLARFELFILVLIGAILIGTSNFIALSGAI